MNPQREAKRVGVYVVPDWLTVIAGLVVWRYRPTPNGREPEVLFGLRSARQEAGKWCLPTGLGVVRRDISSELAANAPESLTDPGPVVQRMSERHQRAFRGPAGFALAEARWYVELPSDIADEALEPLAPIGELRRNQMMVRAYFALRWDREELPKPAETEWPFQEVRFFTQRELQGVDVAFGCDKDLKDAGFWSSTL